MTESKPLNTIHETQCTSRQQPACNIQPDILRVGSLNSNCFCISLDADALKREFEIDAETRNLYPLIL